MRARGFILIVAVLAAIVVAAIVGALVITVGEGRVANVHSMSGNQAQGIAEAGMARAVSVLLANGSRDFDELLDPSGTSCTCNLSSITPTAGAGLGVPVLTDAGNSVVTHAGRQWRRVPYAGGAYLVRIDDDVDDEADVAAWDPHTSNTGSTAAAGCGREGPAGSGNGLLANNLQNPCRDRNRTVWVTVMGIFPGVDPGAAKHSATLRRLHTARLPSTVAGMRVRGNVEVNGNADLSACSPIGRIEADGNFTRGGSGNACACGESRAQSVSGWDHCTDTTRCSSATPAVECADGELEPASITVPELKSVVDPGPDGSDFYVDWSRPCVFYIDSNETLWSWDAQASRGPAASPSCASLEGRALGAPVPPDFAKAGSSSSSNGDDWKGCWTPIIANMTGSCTPVVANNLAGTHSEHTSSGSTCEWRPIGDQSWTLTAAEVDARAGGLGAGLLSGTTTFNKPSWGSCRVLYPPFPDGTPQQNLGCNNTASGASRCVDADSNNIGDNVALVGAHGEVWFGATSSAATTDAAARANLEAVPAGVYFFQDNVNRSGANFDFRASALVAPGLPLTSYPLATIMTTGSIDLNNQFWIGFGQAFGNPDGSGARFPSTLTNGDFTMRGSADYRVAGSIYTTGNVNWQGNGAGTLHGELFTNGNFSLSGNGDFLWRYENALQEAAGASNGPPAAYATAE